MINLDFHRRVACIFLALQPLASLPSSAALDDSAHAVPYCDANPQMCDRVFRVFYDSVSTISHKGAAFSIVSKHQENADQGEIRDIALGTPISLLFVEMQQGAPGETFFCDYADIVVETNTVWCAKPHPREHQVIEIFSITPTAQCVHAEYQFCATYAVKHCSRADYRLNTLDCGTGQVTGTAQRTRFARDRGVPDEGSGTGGAN